MISEDIIFTDILGRIYQEKGFMAGYLAEFPNYRIHVHKILQGGKGAAIIGKTTGSHVPPGIEIQDGLITKWRIYADDDYADRS
jgi:hypothetical protein